MAAYGFSGSIGGRRSQNAYRAVSGDPVDQVVHILKVSAFWANKVNRTAAKVVVSRTARG
ncbi:hypothetical protein [Leptolyngbya sp. 7M]|uniref:hypothetical protein n=1 Tax=Leptolyngbya sp. 7M TaxID=2812896 RepID=UPI001CEC2990|nr:hypothetical protein [Leptolyngbya sp. 7M]